MEIVIVMLKRKKTYESKLSAKAEESSARQDEVFLLGVLFPFWATSSFASILSISSISS